MSPSQRNRRNQLPLQSTESFVLWVVAVTAKVASFYCRRFCYAAVARKADAVDLNGALVDCPTKNGRQQRLPGHFPNNVHFPTDFELQLYLNPRSPKAIFAMVVVTTAISIPNNVRCKHFQIDPSNAFFSALEIFVASNHCYRLAVFSNLIFLIYFQTKSTLPTLNFTSQQ